MFSWPQQRPISTIKRPQKKIAKKKALETLWHGCTGFLWRSSWCRRFLYKRYLPVIHQQSESLSALSDKELHFSIEQLRQQLRRHGYNGKLLCQAFALIREAAGRCLGMYHFDSQLMGGLSLFFGNLAEMQTGEGKTLTAILPAAAAGLAGIPVHVITVNDYLTERDVEEMRPVYEMLGLSVGTVIHGMELHERQQAYACDIVYCTNKELVFDYLKDQLVLKEHKHSLPIYSQILQGKNDIPDGLMQRGLHYAIVDEADSILLDEARTPLIISGECVANEEQEKVYYQAAKLAQSLEAEQDYILDTRKRSVKLTLQGEETVKEASHQWGYYWQGRARRLELIQQALTAAFLFDKDKHYIVRDGKVQIVDEHTGRVMEDRTWEKGLHQLIEIKEDCELTRPRETLAKVSFQRFFRFYYHLSGMSGTSKEVAAELWSVYRLPTVIIPTNKKSRRINLPSKLFKTEQEKWQGVIESAIDKHRQGRAVLVGTGSVKASDELSEMLNKENIEHQVLNAKQDKNEADVVSHAGKAGKITIATSMAGRGTDIKLSPEVKASGGLHVILTELHDASRIDRQLQGRCARMGDPGSFEAMLSLEDSLLLSEKYQWKKNLLLLPVFNLPVLHKVWNYLGLKLLNYSQNRLESQHEKGRQQLLKIDQKQSELLAFISSQ